LTPKRLDDCLVVLKGRLDLNEINDVPSPTDFFITNLVRKDNKGQYILDNKSVYLHPLRANEFDKYCAHEMMHFADHSNKGENIFQDLGLTSVQKSIMSKNIRSYALTCRPEFITCFNENITDGKFYIMQNSEGKRVLRAYQSQFDRPITKDELAQLADFYIKLDGPKLPLSEPPEWDINAMQTLKQDYIEVPFEQN
jgi:hypothetical protein